MYEQKDIVLMPFPYTDLTATKQRPALMLSNKLINKTEDRICCLVTSNPTTEGVFIERKFIKEGRLLFKSWVKSHRIFTINEKIIKKKICTVTNEFHDRVLQELNKYLKRD